jgi:hypothetical protein
MTEKRLDLHTRHGRSMGVCVLVLVINEREKERVRAWAWEECLWFALWLEQKKCTLVWWDDTITEYTILMYIIYKLLYVVASTSCRLSIILAKIITSKYHPHKYSSYSTRALEPRFENLGKFKLVYLCSFRIHFDILVYLTTPVVENHNCNTWFYPSSNTLVYVLTILLYKSWLLVAILSSQCINLIEIRK